MINTILGIVYDDFMPETKSHEAHLDPKSECLPKLLEGYKYPVSSWPVIIEQDQISELEELCTNIPRLIQKIPELYFKNDCKKIADFYFNGDEMLAQFALVCHQSNIEMGCRLDLTLTEDAFKILEVNAGSSIGGWQVQSFEPVIKKFHPELDQNFVSVNTQQNYIAFLVNNTIKHVPALNDKMNIFLGFSAPIGNAVKQHIVSFFDELLEKELTGRKYKGKTFVGNFAELSQQNGDLVFEGTKIDAVLATTLDVEGMPPDVSRASIMKKIYFPDHLATRIYGDKRNLALLRVLAEQQQFTKAENELIFRSIPWTTELENANCIYKGAEHQLVDLLKEQKNSFVVKIAQGFQGKDVFIGKFSTEEEWEKAISNGLEHKNFIVQEFVDSKTFIAPNKENKWVPHKLIWGAFGFGENYGGVWVRMSEEKTDVGIINSASGAVEVIVYEQLFLETHVL